MSIKSLSLLFSIIGVGILFLLSLLIQPIPVSLADIPKYGGRKVVVKGVVTHYTTLDDFQIIELRDGNATTTVFLQDVVVIHSGDLLEVTGKVQKYRGEWEIVVEDSRDINPLSHWENNSVPLWELAEHPEWFKNLNINISGYIESLHENWFILSDGNYSILVTFNYLNPHLSNGDEVVIQGYFTYDPRYTRYVVEVENSYHHIIEVEDGI